MSQDGGTAQNGMEERGFNRGKCLHGVNPAETSHGLAPLSLLLRGVRCAYGRAMQGLHLGSGHDIHGPSVLLKVASDASFCEPGVADCS